MSPKRRFAQQVEVSRFGVYELTGPSWTTCARSGPGPVGCRHRHGQRGNALCGRRPGVA
jgi:hypothetical protein